MLSPRIKRRASDSKMSALVELPSLWCFKEAVRTGASDFSWHALSISTQQTFLPGKPFGLFVVRNIISLFLLSGLEGLLLALGKVSNSNEKALPGMLHEKASWNCKLS